MSDADRSDKFVASGADIMASQCLYCAHKFRPARDKPRCPAFPDGVPRPILANDFDHRQPYQGDNGVRFEPREDLVNDTEFLARLYKRLDEAKGTP